MSLTKIANHEVLSRTDMINAAAELSDLEKQASDADAYGRQLAHTYVEELIKQAEEEESMEKEKKDKEEKERKEKEGKDGVAAEAKREGESTETEEKEKTSANSEIAAAIAVFKKYNLIEA